MTDLKRVKKIINWLIFQDFAENEKGIADIMGYTKSSFSQIVNGKVPLSDKFVDKLASIDKNINKVWVLTGDGEMLKEEKAKEHKAHEPQFAITQFKQRGYAPYYSDLPLSAGQMGLANIEQRENPESWIKFPGVDADGWFPVIGCSMEPKIFAGDIVGVKQIDNWERIDPDKTYMIITHDDRMIKHLETDDNDNSILWAVSENYRRFKISKDEIIRIFRVVWAGRFI